MTIQTCCGNIPSNDQIDGPSEVYNRAPPTSKNCYKTFEFTECGKCCDYYDGGGPESGPMSCKPTDWGGYCDKPGEGNDYYYSNGRKVTLDSGQWEDIQSRGLQENVRRSLKRNERLTDERLREDIRHEDGILRRRYGEGHRGTSRYPRGSSRSSALQDSAAGGIDIELLKDVKFIEYLLTFVVVVFIVLTLFLIVMIFINNKSIKGTLEGLTKYIQKSFSASTKLI